MLPRLEQVGGDHVNQFSNLRIPLDGNWANSTPSFPADAIGSRPSRERSTLGWPTDQVAAPVAAWNILGWVNCWWSFSENTKSDGVRST